MDDSINAPLKRQPVYIADHRALVDLGRAIEMTGENMLRLRRDVDAYLKGVEQAMETCLQTLRQRYDEACRRQADAEAALSACYDSQSRDEESGELKPSCDCERRDLNSACRETDSARSAMEKGQRVMSAVETELRRYRYDGLTATPGGDAILKRLGGDTTTRAGERMTALLELVNQYLTLPLGHAKTPTLEPLDTPESLERYGEEVHDKASKFREASERIIERQRGQNYGDREIKPAARIALCPRCGRPTPQLCVCANQREKEFIFNYNLTNQR